jgi:RimJ/RimL family protein N-acetyltransferase
MSEFERLDTTRLMIRHLRESDLETLVNYRSDNEANRWQIWSENDIARGYDTARGAALIERTASKSPFAVDDSFQFGVALRSTDQLIGDVYLGMDKTGRQAELGYTFDKQMQGKGYATEALTKLLDHVFLEIGLHRVHATTDPRNEASVRLLRRLGMRQEGHLKQNLWFYGEWADDLLFAILASEWKAAS